MSHSILSTVLGSAVADAGTFTYSYPTGKDEGHFYQAMGHKLTVDGNKYSYPDDFDVTLGTASITITNKSGASWAAGATVKCQLEEQGKRAYRDDTGNLLVNTTEAHTFLVNLGAPDTASAAGVAASQTPAAASNLTLTSSTVTLDVPRNITETGVAATVAHNITVTGTDAYGATVVETITGAVGATTVAGKKAFKTITKIAVSAATTGAITVGWGDVLGIPIFLPSAGHVLKEMEDGVAATAGTFVAGIRTAGGSTATTGDVRGTVDPNSACDGAKVFQLLVALPDPGYLGIPQYAG